MTRARAEAGLPPVEATLLALADPTRRGVVELLRFGPLRAGELAGALNMTKSAFSRHLRVLRESGLVREDSMPEDARVSVYSLQREPFDSLRSWLEQVESYWTLQLESFKRHAERTRGPKAKRGRLE
ncbi:MAG TPA: metalloregulator ArsR/SmtB family transcription factor [Polyangiales bacterium]|nr:metalloregulator ArsR/SmtB family transcription factor [Polyangiales bacterium]